MLVPQPRLDPLTLCIRPHLISTWNPKDQQEVTVEVLRVKGVRGRKKTGKKAWESLASRSCRTRAAVLRPPGPLVAAPHVQCSIGQSLE